MRAIEAKTFSGYGGLRQMELPKPQPAKDRVLVRVTAAGVTPLEYTVRKPARCHLITVPGLTSASRTRGKRR